MTVKRFHKLMDNRIFQYPSLMLNISKYASLVRINQFKYSTISTDSKSLEFSDFDNANSNPWPQSISQNEKYQTIVSDDNDPKYSRIRTHIRAMQKQDQTSNKNKDRSGSYTKLWNVSSVTELHQVLNEYKNNHKTQKTPKTRNRVILNLLDKINDDGNKSDNDTQNDDKQTTKTTYKIHLPDAYSRAIRKCGHLKEYNEGFKLFEEAKSEPGLLLNANVYAAIMSLKMQQNYNRDSLKECYDLMDEMTDNYKLNPSSSCYRELLTNSINLREFPQARCIVNRILYTIDEKMRYKLLSGDQSGHLLRVAITMFYARTKEIENGLKFIGFLVETFGKSIVDDALYSTMITGMAIVARDGDKSIIEIAEKLFKQSFIVLGRCPEQGVFSSLINVYACIPDIYSCMDVLKEMINNPDWPMPNDITYNAALKALSKYGVGISKTRHLEYEDGWKLTNEILSLMNEHNVERTEATYCTLFNLCSGTFCGQGDISKLYQYYNEMIDSRIGRDVSSLNALLMGGIDCYALEIESNSQNKEAITIDLKEFIEWGLLQYKQNGVKLPHQTEKNARAKLKKLGFSFE